MIGPEEPYGWGALALPVYRLPAAADTAADRTRLPGRFPHLGDAISWPALLISALATLLALAATLLHRPALPPAAAKAQPRPVEISYLIARSEARPPAATVPPPEVRRQAEAPPVTPPVPPKKAAPSVAAASRPPAALPVSAPPPTPATPPAEVVSISPPAVGKPPRVRNELPPPARALDRAPAEIALDAQPTRQSRPQRQAAPELPPAGQGLTLDAAPAAELAAPRRERSSRPAEARSALPPAIAFEASAPAAVIEVQPAPAPARRGQSTAPPAPAAERASLRIPREPTVAVAVPAPAKKGEASQPAETAQMEKGAFAFLDRISPAELDRSLLVSLNRLDTCLDPGAEFALKTRLATLLSHPGLCRSGGVVFQVMYPESAYSIHLGLYNYERREFADRCAALRQTVECFEARR